jgi:hypothetical protein
MLASLITYMVEEDGLTDDQLPIFHRYGGGSIIRNLYETRDERKATGSNLPPMNLVERRNRGRTATRSTTCRLLD